MKTKTKHLKNLIYLLLVSLSFFISCEKDAFDSNVDKHSHKEKNVISFKEFLEKTKLKKFNQFISNNKDKSQNFRQVSDITGFVIDTTLVKQHIMDSGDYTFTLSVTPLPFQNTDELFYNIVFYKKDSNDWQWSVLEYQKNSQDEHLYSVSEIVNDMNHNGLVNMKVGGEWITVTTYHCTGTGFCASGVCDDCGECITILSSYEFTSNDNPTITVEIIKDNNNSNDGTGSLFSAVILGFMSELSDDGVSIFYATPEIQNYLNENTLTVMNPNYNPLLGGNETITFIKPEAKQFAIQAIAQIILNPNFTFEQATTINIIENLSNQINEDPVELYLLLKYKHSSLLNASTFSSAGNSISVGSYTLTPHYKTNGTLVYYTAARYSSSTGTPINDIEYIIKPSGLSNFQDKIDLYTAAANLFYMNGIPSQGQIAMAAGDYIIGLKDMWASALTDPQYYIYLAHIFVASATNLNAVSSTGTTFEGKIKFTFETQGNSVSNIVINNRSFSQYKQLISNKFGVEWNIVAQTNQGTVEVIHVGGTKYVARPFASSPNFDKTIEYWRNGTKMGEFRFNN